jgi:hypothetical protein
LLSQRDTNTRRGGIAVARGPQAIPDTALARSAAVKIFVAPAVRLLALVLIIQLAGCTLIDQYSPSARRAQTGAAATGPCS